MAVNLGAVSALGAGLVFVYAGLKGYSIPHTIQTIIQGNSPANQQQIAPIGDSGSPGTSDSGTGSVVSGGSAQAVLQKTAAQFGWGSGAQWQALQNIEMGEAGFNPQAKNPTSGAYGLAQSLGHPFPGGPASNGVNEYGGEGLSPAQSRAASEGDPAPQALWMCRYIQERYGDPTAAWAFHQAHDWY